MHLQESEMARGPRGTVPLRAWKRLASIGWTGPVIALVAGFVIAKFVTTFAAYFVVAAMIAIVLGLALVRNLQLGVLIYFFTAALALGESPGVQSPYSTYRAGLMPSEVFLVFLAVLWSGRAAFVDGMGFVKSALNLPLAALWLVAFVSLILSNVLKSTSELRFHQTLITQVAEVGLLSFSICAFFLAANSLRDSRWVRRVFAPVVVLGMYFAAHRILKFDFPIPMTWGSFLLAAAIAFVYSRLLFARLKRHQAVGLAVVLLVMLFAAYSKWSWVSGWIAATGAVLAVSWFRSKPLALGLMAVVLIALFVFPGLYYLMYEESEFGGDFDRFTIWRDAFAMMLSTNPVLGVGPGNYYPYVYSHSTLWFGGQTYTTAHSNYVQIAAELGLVGLAVFLWVIAAGVWTGVRAVRMVAQEFRWLAVAATSIFAAMAVASIFGDYMFPSRGNNGLVTFGTTVYTWLIMGAAVAAANLGKGASSGDL